MLASYQDHFKQVMWERKQSGIYCCANATSSKLPHTSQEILDMHVYEAQYMLSLLVRGSPKALHCLV